VIVLVVGATGDLGAAVARALVSRGADVRAMTRSTNPDVDGVASVVRADLSAPDSLTAAFSDVQRVFLVSSPVREQVALETNAIAAAEAAGVEHIVKVSNIPIAGIDDGLHGNHRAIERRLTESSVGSTVLQPSFFTSVLLRQLTLLQRGRLVFPTGDGRIAWIDPRDIADVAAVVLLEPDPQADVLRLTGPEALTAAELAARVGTVMGRELELLQPDLKTWSQSLREGGMDPWLVSSTVHLYEAVTGGALADLSDAVGRVLHRAPQPVEVWLQDELLPRLRQ
jgi:uncharacterized protein YbjT (DUF2867 family)